MPERKKQHYIPQFYMRGFTDNERLRSYQLDHRQEFPPTPIHNLCYENYFYGEKSEVEDATSKLEDRLAAVLRSVREQETLNAIESTEDETYFFIFLTHTHARTKTAKLETREHATDMVRVLLEANVGAMEGDEEEMRKHALEQIENGDLWVEHTGMFPMVELCSMYGPYLIGDLTSVLLKDTSGRGFIFADHPVALDNPMSKEHLVRSNIGFQAPGLQLFCPISNDLAVMMYDPACYSAPDRELIEIGSDTVEELNKLQLVNALNAVFYEDAGRESEVQIMHDEINDCRIENLNQVQKFDADDPRFDTENEVIGFGRNTTEFITDLPFLELIRVDTSPVRSPKRHRIFQVALDEVRQEAEKRAEETNT